MKNKGFTLIELLIVVATIGVMGAITYAGYLDYLDSKTPDPRPVAEATAWAKSLGFRDANVNCVAQDTDGDGYVSCTVATSTSDGRVTAQAVECARRSSFNLGCRIPKLTTRGGD